MIDICPVGALTSKPFRYAARTWELARRKSVSPHDSLGSNLVVQVKGDRVLRVVPFENQAVNECWISDKDRFSYEALASDERLTAPMIKERRRVEDRRLADGARIRRAGPQGRSPTGTAAPRWARSSRRTRRSRRWRSPRGSPARSAPDNIDFRLRQTDFRGDGHGAGIPWLGMPIADLDALDRVLVVGSFLRKDHPLVAQRLRQAARKGAQISVLHSVADDSRIRSRTRSSPRRRCCRARSRKSSSPPRAAPASRCRQRSRRSSRRPRRR